MNKNKNSYLKWNKERKQAKKEQLWKAKGKDKSI